MFDFFRRLGAFWIILVACALGGYFCLFNLDYIYVNIPHIAELKVRAAVAFIGCFLSGASVVIVFFGFDAMKKSFIIGQKNRKIKDLERKLARFDKSTPPESALDVNPALNADALLD